MAKAAPPDVKGIVAGLDALAIQLGIDAAWMAIQTNDLANLRSTRRTVSDLFYGYWEYTYRTVFLSAFYSLTPAVRNARELRDAPSDGVERFLKTAAKHVKRGAKLPPKSKLSTLTYFDGTKARRIVTKSKATIDRLLGA